MYESPITLNFTEPLFDMQKQFNNEVEQHIMYTVKQTFNVDVNEEELIKALEYDREQYEKGKRDLKDDIYKMLNVWPDFPFTLYAKLVERIEKL